MTVLRNTWQSAATNANEIQAVAIYARRAVMLRPGHSRRDAAIDEGVGRSRVAVTMAVLPASFMPERGGRSA
jgi:hypothetical protein